MKKTRIFLGIIAIVAIVGFGFMGCNEDNDTGKTDPCAKEHTPGAAATCEKAQTCTVCSYVIKAATGHNFGDNSDWVESAEAATCTDPSYDTRDCKNASCTVKEKRAGSHHALGHNLPGAKAATCIATGSTGTGHCDRCNQNFTGETIPINSEAHDFSEEPVITPAACEMAGKEVITCGNAGCNVKHETPIDALEHDWDWTENSIAASCVQVSKDTATCKNTPCIKTNERNGSNPALGHTTPQSKPATCTSTGLTGTGHCDRCKEDLTGGVIPIDPNNHDYGEWRLKTAPTCVTPARHTRVCSYNNAHTEEQDYGEINPTAHYWNWILNAIAATCVQVSKDTANCNNTPCTAANERDGSNPVNPTAHNWGDDAVTEPTCTNYGYTIQKCTFCFAPTREITIAMWDNAGDGWDGSGALRINVNGVNTANNVKVQTTAANNNPSGQRRTNEYKFTVKHGDIVRIYWLAGINQGENAFAVYYSNAPPSPSFNPTSTQWSPSNDPEGKVLVYRQYYTMDNISGGTLLGTITDIGTVTRRINIVDALGHNWENDVVTAPTCGTAGYTTQTCSKCPETRQTNPTQATGQHSFSNSICSTCYTIEMAEIEAGTLTWGSATITLTAFKMSKYEVTQEQYQEVMGTNPSYFSSNPADGETQSKRPVERVTWFDAIEFCNKLSEKEGLTPVYTITGRTPATGYPITAATVEATWTNNGYRLPTEAQWEYACRAGSTTYWQSEPENYAWYNTNANNMTHEVGKKQPNAFGLYDMHGNVWEWCWDWYGNYPTTAQTDYMGAVTGTARVRRGGCWSLSVTFTWSDYRSYIPPINTGSNAGFRLVRP